MCCAFCHVVVVATTLFVLCFGRRSSGIRVIAGLGFRAVVSLLLIGELLCRTLILLRVDIESYGACHSFHRGLNAALLCDGKAGCNSHQQRNKCMFKPRIHSALPLERTSASQPTLK